MAASSFQELSRQTASHFIQTVVIVDDQASFEESLQDKPTLLQSPPQRLTQASKEADILDKEGLVVHPSKIGPEIPSPPTPGNDSQDISHKLDAKRIIDSFVDEGIVCSVIKPSQDEPTDKITKLLCKSDIVILDWLLHNDSDKTIEFITEVLAADSKQGNRLRLIIILTGETEPDKIIDKIIKISSLSKDTDTQPDKLLITKGNFLRILVKVKPQTKVTSEKFKFRLSTFDEIANIVINEFTHLTSGLVSNVAIESVSKIRENTHRLLARFHRDLDIPYLTHRILLPQTEDSQEHLTDLIASELRLIVDQVNTSKLTGKEAIQLWVTDYESRFCPDKDAWKDLLDNDYSKELLSTLLQEGLSDSTIEKINPHISKSKTEKAIKSGFKSFSQILCGEVVKSNQLDSEFAVITSLGRFFGNLFEHPIKLTQGTLVLLESTEIYLLCKQPRCDSVRLDSKRAFPFIPLNISDQGFNLVVPSDKDYIRLKSNAKPFELLMISFEPDPASKTVIASVSEDKYYFSDIEGKRYQWIAELKRDHTQRIANNFASLLSRVGLDESEWLRRHS